MEQEIQTVRERLAASDEQPLAMVQSFGCQLNMTDGEKLKWLLLSMGYGLTEEPEQADLILLGLCCAASVFGIAMIYSATRYNNDNRKIIVQTAALLIGIVVYFGISMIDLEMLIKRWKWIAAFDVLFILLLKTPFGVSDNTGNTAWLKFPFLPVSIGPAEVVKITFIILLAWQLQWLREEKRDLRSFSAAFYVGGHTLGIAGLYFVISGDMGNALMFLLIFVVMSFVAGFALRWFALLFGASGAVIGGIIAFDLVPDSKKYMLNRFIVLFDHSYDVQHTGWQQTRSLLTIGGGGFWGQGYLHGTQTQAGAGSVPARHTDLIFAVIGEELGFIGAVVIIIFFVRWKTPRPPNWSGVSTRYWHSICRCGRRCSPAKRRASWSISVGSRRILKAKRS